MTDPAASRRRFAPSRHHVAPLVALSLFIALLATFLQRRHGRLCIIKLRSYCACSSPRSLTDCAIS